MCGIAAEPTREELLAENEKLRAQLQEAEATLRAIRSGEVDAIVVECDDGLQVFTLSGADRVYRALIEDMNEGALTVTAGGMIVYANRRFADMIKVPLEQVFGANLQQWIAPEDQPLFASLLDPAAATVSRTEISLRAADGATVTVSLAANRLAVSEPSGALCIVVTDLTERKHAEDELRRSESLLRLVSDNMPAYVAYVGAADLCYKFVNRQYEIAFQRPREQIIGRSMHAVLGDDSFAIARPYIERALHGEACSYQDVLSRADGQRWHQVNFVPSVSQSGAVDGIVILNHDITELKQAAADLAASQAMYRLLAENSSDGVSLIGKTGEVLYASPAYTARLGYAIADVIHFNTSDILQLIHPEDRDRIAAEIQRGRREKLPTSRYQYRIRSTTGEYVWLEDVLRRDFDDDGEFVRTIVSSREVTDRVKAEEERDRLRDHLAQAQKMELVGRLAGGIAHEFNNMLAVIMLRTEMLLQRPDLTATQQSSLNEILLVAQRAATLVRSLLGYARKQIIHPQVIDLNTPVKDALPILRKLIGEAIELEWKPATNLWPVKIDPSQFDQILVNLCVNARDAITGTGKVTIVTTNVDIPQTESTHHLPIAAGRYTVLTVADTGCGMDQEVLTHIFEPFYTTKEVGSGTGLGLATVDGIVQQNRGHIQVNSSPGAGATFTIYLPSHTERTTKTTGDASKALRKGRGETLLLVEDEPVILEMAAEALEYLGYQVIAEVKPEDAIRAMENRARPVDLLVSDIVMPTMSGLELAQQLSVLQPGIKCLFVSGYPNDGIARQGVPGSNVQYLQKPYSLQELADSVSQALGNATTTPTPPD